MNVKIENGGQAYWGTYKGWELRAYWSKDISNDLLIYRMEASRKSTGDYKAGAHISGTVFKMKGRSELEAPSLIDSGPLPEIKRKIDAAGPFKNSAQMPKVFYGLHCAEGVAQYDDPQIQKSDGYRILLGEQALKKMDKTFAGKPVYVNHVSSVDLENLQQEADGYVIESFYNPPDGKHWVKFLVVSDDARTAISAGWVLSNAYIPKEFSGGGKWHNVDYLKEVMDGEYEHLALVQNPRYSESIILTPEEFKAYNSEREAELIRLANSKEEPSMLNFFTKKKLENAVEIEATTVALKSGRELSIKQLVNEVEAAEEKKKNEDLTVAENAGKPVMANEEHMVECNGKMMSVADMKNAYSAMMEKPAEKKDNVDPAAEKAVEKPENEKKEDEKPAPVENKEDAPKDDKKKENEEEKKPEDEKKVNSVWFEKMKNAPKLAEADAASKIDLSEDKVARGKTRYGSN